MTYTELIEHLQYYIRDTQGYYNSPLARDIDEKISEVSIDIIDEITDFLLELKREGVVIKGE